MERVPTPSSSNVDSIGYDHEQQLLEVAFKARAGKPPAVYDYRGVPLHKWHGLLHSPTKGGYIAAEIKTQYPVTRVG